MTIRKPARLLLVDDDPGLLKLLGMRLVSEGYSVLTAESGPEALRTLSRDKVDLVVSDLRMDEMDGLQLFSEIQKVQPGMPVIILTAHGSIPDAVAATQQGVFSFLTKPVDKDALYKAIDDALEQSAPTTDERWRQAIVTRSPLMERLLEQAGMVAQSDVSVLINGTRAVPARRLSPRQFITPARAAINLLSPLTAARFPSSCWSQSCFTTPAALLPARSAIARGYSRLQKAGPCFLMKSAICRWRCRLNCCASCRSVKCARWAATAISTLMCGLFLRPIATCRRPWRAASFAKICFIVSTW